MQAKGMQGIKSINSAFNRYSQPRHFEVESSAFMSPRMCIPLDVYSSAAQRSFKLFSQFAYKLHEKHLRSKKKKKDREIAKWISDYRP